MRTVLPPSPPRKFDSCRSRGLYWRDDNDDDDVDVDDDDDGEEGAAYP